MSARRLLLRLGIAAGVVVLLLAVATWFLLGTQAGARWLFTRAGGAIAGTLEVERLEGPIRGPLTAHGLVYETDSFEVRIERLTLEWRLRELLRRRLDVVSLDAQGVDVLLAGEDERDEEPSPLPDVHLPINVLVRAATVRDLEIRSPGEDPLIVESVELSTHAEGDVFVIDRFDVVSPDLDLEVRGSLEPVGDYPIDLTVAWSLRLEPSDGPEEAATWSGEGTLSGTLEELRVDQRLSAPLVASIDARLRQPLRQLTFDATIEAEPFSLPVLGADLPAATVAGRIDLAGEPETFSATADLSADVPELGPLRAEAELAVTGERWRIDRLVVTSPAAATRIETSGEIVLPPAEREEPVGLDLRAAWTDLVWPLTGEPALTSERGELTVDGSLEDYDLTMSGVVASSALPPTPVALAGSGSSTGLLLDRFRAEALDGTLSASGRVDWSPEVSWDLDVEGERLDPTPLLPAAYREPPAPRRSDLALTASASGRLAEAGAFGRVDPLQISGTLRGQPLAASTAVTFAGERIALERLATAWGSLRLTASGDLLPELGLELSLEAPELDQVVPDGGGSLNVRGRLSGPPETPRIALSVDGVALIWGELSIAELSAETDLDLAPGGTLDLTAEARRLVSGERLFERVEVALDGSREAHRLTAAVDGGENDGGEGGGVESSGLDSLRLAARGGLDADTVWQGEIATLDLALSGAAGSWSLAAPAAVVAGTERAEVERLCEVSGDARLCLDGSWSATAGWRAEIALEALPLALAESFLPPELALSGTLGGRLSARGDTILLFAEADLGLGPGELEYPVADGSTDTLRFGAGSLTATVDGAGLTAELSLPLPELGSARAGLSLPGYRLAGAPADDQPIAATLTADVTDLSFLQAFSDQLDDTAGRLDADLTVGGTLGQPRLGGEARLQEGRAAVPELGIRLTEMTLTATGAGADAPAGRPLSIEGSVRSGEGTLTLSGQAPAVPSPDDPIRVAIRGRRFEAMSTPEIEILASPDLELTYDGGRLALTGEVEIPEAKIEIDSPPASAVTVSDDVVYIGGDRETAVEEAIPLELSVRVIFGAKVEVQALGLKAEPTGSLLLVDEPGRPTTGTGEINLAGGTFKAYGQDLTIERGRLVFRGPIDDPFVDLRAYRRADDGVVAGLEATGRLERPEISLWSEPPMNQADQLSYILLGRPVDAASQSDGNLLANAAASLGLKGGNLLAERLATRFGLEEARIETSGGLADAQLVLGKFLSPRLYVAYGVGLFDAANTLRLRYLLSSKWSLEATTGVGTSADLLYTIERGRGAKRRLPPADPSEGGLDTPPVPAGGQAPPPPR